MLQRVQDYFKQSFKTFEHKLKSDISAQNDQLLSQVQNKVAQLNSRIELVNFQSITESAALNP